MMPMVGVPLYTFSRLCPDFPIQLPEHVLNQQSNLHLRLLLVNARYCTWMQAFWLIEWYYNYLFAR
jgi:hypothetical protein